MPPDLSPTPSPALLAHGVHLIGDFQGSSALSGIARDLAELFHQLRLPVQTLDLPISPDRQTSPGRFDFSGASATPPASPVSIIAWNGDINPHLAALLPASLFENRHIVGTWYWETELPPPAMVKGYDLVDEVWVTTRYIAEALGKSAPVPIRHFPHLLVPPTPPAAPRLPEALRNERFLFLFSFDFRSVSRRKNPHGVCEAFTRAFPRESPDGPLCVIKSLAGRSQHWFEFAELKARYAHRGDILFIDGWLDREERDSLMQRAQCYVSLHRAEGLGLTLMESMALGKPCITTAYSGNMDFTDDANAWLVPFKKVPVGEGAWPYPASHPWAEPDLDHAARCLREAWEQPALLAQKGAAARETLLRQHGIEAVGGRMVTLLNDLLARPPRPKPALQTPGTQAASGRKRVAEMLKELRALEKNLRRDGARLRGPLVSARLIQAVQDVAALSLAQQELHRETLKELAELSSRMAGYHPSVMAGLVRDRDMLAKLLELQAPDGARALK